MGGLAVQKLIAINKGYAGVCIDSAPPKGIFTTSWSFLRGNLPTINPLKGNSVCLPGVEWFQYSFCNTMSIEETTVEYIKSVVPESRNIPRSSTKKDGYVDFRNPHNPLLFIAGEKDHLIPSLLNKKNFKAYKDKNSITDFMVFAGRTHYICGQCNWQEVAGYILNWLNKL
jgi:esterase/lipase